MKITPFFSIILPVYNVERYLVRCLTSILKQSFKDIEIVFVDDCGEDKSIEIIQRYLKEDKRIKLIQNHRNLGTYHARKKGVDSASGKYILFLDPDDELEINFLHVLFEHIMQEKSDLIFYAIEYNPKRKFYQSKIPVLPFSDSSRIIEAIHEKKGKRVVWAGTAGKVYQRELIKQVYTTLNISQNYRYIYTEDKLLYYAALLRNPIYSSLDYKGYIYHNNAESATNIKQLTDPNDLIEQFLFTTDKLKELVAQTDLNYKELTFFDYSLNDVVDNQVSLMRRYECNSKKYLFHVWNAFKIIPSLKQLARIFLFLISFKKIKA